MSDLHLGKDSEMPKPVEGLARLYSMKYCPYAQRIRLILSLKKIPHDTVNINLKNKPEWYFKIHPEGKVPGFVDKDGTVVVDSTVIANYIDEKYPEPALYREETKPRDEELLQSYNKITTLFGMNFHGQDKRPLEEIVMDMEDYFMEYENELISRSTKFFGGEQPGMLDVLMWPWVERAKLLPMIHKKPYTFNKEKFPNLLKWTNDMREQDFVIENACSCEVLARLLESMNAGNVDYDNI